MLTQFLAKLGNYKWWKFLEKQDKIISDADFQGLFTLCKHLVQYFNSEILQQILIKMLNLSLSTCKHTWYFFQRNHNNFNVTVRKSQCHSTISAGLYEAFLRMEERLSKKIGHHDWSTTKIWKKGLDKTPYSSPKKTKSGPNFWSKSHIRNYFLENIISCIKRFYICPDISVEIIRVCSKFHIF